MNDLTDLRKQMGIELNPNATITALRVSEDI